MKGFVVYKSEYDSANSKPDQYIRSYLLAVKNNKWVNEPHEAFFFFERSAAEVIACTVDGEVMPFDRSY